MKKLFLVLVLLFYVQEAKSLEHTIYIEHPTVKNDGDQGHSYARELEGLRNALTIPVEGDPNLRVTRDTPNSDLSVIHVIRLDENGNEQSPIDLVVRTRDLYVLGFINGARNNRILYRFREPQPHHYASQTTASATPQWTVSNIHQESRNLDFSYDYPSIEGIAGQSRYHNNIRISRTVLYDDFNQLSLYSNNSENAQRIARAVLRIIIGYFESIRFNSILSSVNDAFVLGRTWAVDGDSAVLTNSWMSLTEFGSRSSLGSSSSSFIMPRPGGSIRSLSYSITNALTAVNNAVPLRNVLAVALGSTWRRSSCPNLGRHRRDASDTQIQIHPVSSSLKSNMRCKDDTLVKLGPTYFEREVGNGILSAVLD